MRAFLFLMMIAAAAACGASTTQDTAVTPSADAVLEVENRDFSDMTLFIVRESGERIRLGLVPGNSTQRLRIPSYALTGTTAVRFLADPVGATRTPVSQDITVQPGDVVRLEIPPQ